MSARVLHFVPPASFLASLGLIALAASCNRHGGDGGVQPPNGGDGTVATELVSHSQDGLGGDGASRRPSLSADGNFVAFESSATNLVTGDTNSLQDVFVYDRGTATMTRVSVDSGGVEADGASSRPVLSSDGRFVAFQSDATNLVADDTNGVTDVFVHDRVSGATTRVSVSSASLEANGASTHPSISGNGRLVAFRSTATNLVAGDTNAAADIFVHDRDTGATIRVSLSSAALEANGASSAPTLSRDGRFVAFASVADDLVPSDTNGVQDVFVHELLTGTTSRISRDSLGVEGGGASDMPALSGDGRFVAFLSDAANLVADDTNAARDIFVHDRQSGATTRVSVASAGDEADAASPPAGISVAPSISADGRFVAFTSAASNLVSDDTNGAADVFRHDRSTGQTLRVNLTSGGVQSLGDPLEAVSTAISVGGSRIAFHSAAEGLVPGDANGQVDVFLRTEPIPVLLGGDGWSFEPPSAVRLEVSGVELALGSGEPLVVTRRIRSGVDGPRVVSWRADIDPPVSWLLVSPPSGTEDGENAGDLELELHPAGLPPARHRARVLLRGLASGELLAELLVELDVLD